MVQKQVHGSLGHSHLQRCKSSRQSVKDRRLPAPSNVENSTCVNCSTSEYITDSRYISQPSWGSAGLKDSSFGKRIWTEAKVNIPQSVPTASPRSLMQLCLIRKVLQHLVLIFYSAYFSRPNESVTWTRAELRALQTAAVISWMESLINISH